MAKEMAVPRRLYRPARKRAPAHTDIALRAYEIYVGRGAEAGREIEDWLQAESELMGRRRIAPRRSGSG